MEPLAWALFVGVLVLCFAVMGSTVQSATKNRKKNSEEEKDQIPDAIEWLQKEFPSKAQEANDTAINQVIYIGKDDYIESLETAKKIAKEFKSILKAEFGDRVKVKARLSRKIAIDSQHKPFIVISW